MSCRPSSSTTREAPGALPWQAFNAEGSFLGSTALPMSEEGALAVGPDGSVYVTGLLESPNGGWGVLRLAPAR